MGILSGMKRETGKDKKALECGDVSADVEVKRKGGLVKDGKGGASGGTSLMEWSSGSQPLMDARKERYAQYYAGGSDGLTAYFRAFKDDEGLPRGKKSTAKSTSHKVKKQKEVIERILYLQRENAGVARIDREAKLKITEEVISGLREDFRKGERGKTVNDLMSALQRHDLMTGEGEKPSLEIKLNFGGLISGIEKLVESRLGLAGSGKSIDFPVARDGEVVDVSDGGDGEEEDGEKEVGE